MEQTLQQIIGNIDTYGYFAIFSAMLFTGVGLPVPGELTLALTGYLIVNGQLAMFFALAAAALGDMLGAVICYKIGFAGRNRVIGRYFSFLVPADSTLQVIENWLSKYGMAAVVIGRMLPVIRGAIPITAGFARMEERSYSIGIAGSSLVWCGVLIFLGMELGYNWQQISENNNFRGFTAAAIVILVMLSWYLIFLRKKLK